MAGKLDDTTIVAIAGVVATLSAAIALWEEDYYQPSGVRLIENEGRAERWVEETLRNADRLYIETRLRREAFDGLVEFLRNRWLVEDSRRSIEEKVLTFLYICAHGVGYRNAHCRSGRSLRSISL